MTTTTASSSQSSSRFSTLLLREWMQHKRGWLITLLLPPGLFLALLPIGQVQGMPLDKSLLLACVILLISTIGLFFIALAAATFQLPGLARRDVQDRSIEFWLSLPAGHSESIGATLLAHTVLVPLAALVLGFLAGGLLIAPGLLLKQGGMEALNAVPWGQVMSLAVPGFLRVLFGAVLMILWLAPLGLLLMAASAWLKRWGVAAVLITLTAGGAILENVYGITLIKDLVQAQLNGASRTMIGDVHILKDHLQALEHGMVSFQAGSWAAQDAWVSMQNLASPHFIGGLIFAAGCFALMVLKRSRIA